MKHILAVAIQNGFNAALAQEIQNGNISIAAAEQAGRFALAIAREYLKGNRPYNRGIEEFGGDGEKWEAILKSEKINLQKWNDI